MTDSDTLAMPFQDFLRKVHEQDIASGKGIHREGVCSSCDAMLRMSVGEKPPTQMRQCLGTNTNGKRCGRRGWADENGYLCHTHQHQDGVEEGPQG